MDAYVDASFQQHSSEFDVPSADGAVQPRVIVNVDVRAVIEQQRGEFSVSRPAAFSERCIVTEAYVGPVFDERLHENAIALTDGHSESAAIVVVDVCPVRQQSQ